MNRPTTIKVFGQKYKVRYDYTEDEENNGLCDFQNNTIHIRPGLPNDKTLRVLFHEITHALINETPLCERKRFGEEEVCDIVGFHFADMLKDNPKLITWLLEK